MLENVCRYRESLLLNPSIFVKIQNLVTAEKIDALQNMIDL